MATPTAAAAAANMEAAQAQIRADLLDHLKREVKQIMEEAAVRRHISEDGASVSAVCVSVEACLSHGLKRRLFGLFGSPSTFALLHKIAPSCPAAASIVKMVIQIEQAHFKTQKSDSRFSFEKRVGSISTISSAAHSSFPSTATSTTSKTANNSASSIPVTFRNLWIRLSLFEKVLSSIVEYIGKNGSRFYEPEALMRDPVSASMVSDLLVGPCALEYSKMKTLDNYWTDPPAEELLQRHRIHSRGTVGALYAAGANNSSSSVTSSPKSPRPPLQVKRNESLGPDEMAQKLSASAREYVMSLHQNTKASLLYGKNGVSVWPADVDRPLRGYLSLHQNFNSSLTIKWTPNVLMHSGSDPVQPCQIWRYALNLEVQDIVYLHYHHSETGGSIVFVGADGVQHPPIQFPTGQHPLSFLTCLENGMGDWGRLDPPLWSQKGTGKVFPKLKRRSSVSNGRFNNDHSSTCHYSDHQEGAYGDYVFRLVFLCRPGETPPTSSSSSSKMGGGKGSGGLFSFSFKDRFLSLSSSPATTPPTTPKSRSSLQQSPAEQSSPVLRKEEGTEYAAATADAEQRENENVSPREQHQQQVEFKSQLSAPPCMESADDPTDGDVHHQSRNKLQNACKSMRYQILSRAFYGWLAHCRHLKTIRTHLSGLLISETIVDDGDGGDDISRSLSRWRGVTTDEWARLKIDKLPSAELEFYRRVYFGNIAHELRTETWPILLGLYSWNEDDAERAKIHEKLRNKYEDLLTEWTAVEAIVRERDREAFRAARGANENRYSAERKRPDSAAQQQPQLRCASNEVFDLSEDEKDARPNNASTFESIVPSTATNGVVDGALVMEALEGVSEVKVLKPTADQSSNNRCAPIMSTSSSITDRTPEQGDGGLFSMHIIETFALNLHRIEKDVHRCDRNHPYFNVKNLEKLKNVMCTYVWENLHTGYVQGMCDLAAVLLVVFDDEVLTYGCFSQQMKRMSSNFPHGGGMDTQLANLRSLLQVFDPELFDLMQKNGDYTHFYFAYRWFLLDFKRELLYNDVFKIWEIIWAAKHVASPNFVVFLSMAMIQIYRDIILDNNMDFTDVIKFFNEMAEKHDAKLLVELARNLVLRLQKAVEK